MKLLVWQWGRRGGGPRYAIELAEALRTRPGIELFLSLSVHSEVLRGPAPPRCDLPWPTYDSLPHAVWRLLTMKLRIGRLARRLRAFAPDVALCAMPGMLDLEMAAALRRAGIPFFVVVHDADLHPGDGVPFQMMLQRRLVRRACGLVALSAHVAGQIRRGYDVGCRPLLLSDHPPRLFAGLPPPPRAHGGRLRLLCFGRLRPYKGLDLLAKALSLLGHQPELEVRVVGEGRESPELEALRALPGVTVENRWVPEDEVGALIGWADAMVLPHREASQSGAAAVAITARRWVVATRVGGIAEQLRGETLARLCDPTPESLAAALRRLLEDPPPVCAPAADPWQAWHATVARLIDQISPPPRSRRDAARPGRTAPGWRDEAPEPNRSGRAGGVDPADMAVATAVDDVQLAGGAVAEHHHLLVGEVHAHHRIADRKPGDLGRLLGDDGGIGGHLGGCVGFGPRSCVRPGVVLLAQDVLPGGLRLVALGQVALGDVAGVVVDPPAVAAQPLGDVLGGVVEGAVGIGGLALAAQGQAAAGMDVDVAGEEAPGAAEGDLGFQGTVEIFGGDRVELPGHPCPQRLGQVNLLPGNGDLHAFFLTHSLTRSGPPADTERASP